jgi:excisionase family DNA binding protein
MTERISKPPRQWRVSKPPSPMSVRGTRSRPIGKLHTIGELAELWAVSPRTLQRAIKSGALRVHRLGRLVRISDGDAAAFLDENHDD